MSILDKRLAILAIPALLGLGIAGANAGDENGDGPVQCSIQAKADDGMIAFRGVLETNTGLSGSYSFHIESSGHGGSTNIRQGGNFTAEAGEEVHLGQAAVSGGGQYEVKFEITANGETYECE